MCEVVGLPLCFVSVFGYLEGGGHYSGIVDQAVKSAFFGKNELGCGYHCGEGEVVDFQEGYVSLRIECFDAGDGDGALSDRSST